MGLSEERLMFGYCTAAEGQKFQQEAIKFDKIIQKLGPSPLKIKDSTPTKKAKA